MHIFRGQLRCVSLCAETASVCRQGCHVSLEMVLAWHSEVDIFSSAHGDDLWSYLELDSFFPLISFASSRGLCFMAQKPLLYQHAYWCLLSFPLEPEAALSCLFFSSRCQICVHSVIWYFQTFIWLLKCSSLFLCRWWRTLIPGILHFLLADSCGVTWSVCLMLLRSVKFPLQLVILCTQMKDLVGWNTECPFLYSLTPQVALSDSRLLSEPLINKSSRSFWVCAEMSGHGSHASAVSFPAGQISPLYSVCQHFPTVPVQIFFWSQPCDFAALFLFVISFMDWLWDLR